MKTRVLMWPYVRKSVKGKFAYLYDFELQKSWFGPETRCRFWNSLDYHVLDYLFDGPPHLYSRAPEQVGISLYNMEEADNIANCLDFFMENFDGEMPDSYYVNHPAWPRFTSWAKEIVEMMEANEQKYNFAHDLQDFDYDNDLVRKKKMTQEELYAKWDLWLKNGKDDEQK